MIHISASQIEVFSNCKQKWGYQYIQGIKPKQTAGAAFGDELHKALEHYLKTGEIKGEKDIKKLIEKAVKKCLIPRPTDNIEVETEFSIPIDIDVSIVGKIDCVHLEFPFRIIDHKYLSNLAFMKSTEELKNNIQAIIYSWAFPRLYQITENWFFNTWVYYNAIGYKRPKKIGKVQSVVDCCKVLEVDDRFEILYNLYIKEMIDIKRDKQIDRCDKNFIFCEAFGGCPFLKLCNPSVNKKFMARIIQDDLRRNKKPTEEKMTSKFVEMLKKQNQKTQKENKPEEKEIKSLMTSKLVDKLNENQLKEKKSLKQRQEEDGVKTINTFNKSETETTHTKSVKKRKENIKSEENKPSYGLGVLFGCSIIKPLNDSDIRVYNLIDILEPIIKKICEEHNVVHWNLIQYVSKSVLAKALDDYLTENKFNGLIICQRYTSETEAVKEVLIKHANLVIHALG